jgi:hypothetical protein
MSPLILQEMIFTLGKPGVEPAVILRNLDPLLNLKLKYFLEIDALFASSALFGGEVVVTRGRGKLTAVARQGVIPYGG